jgi:hypothetical protein
MGVIDWLKKALGPGQEEPPLPRRSPGGLSEKPRPAAPEKEKPAGGGQFALRRRYQRFPVEDGEIRAKAALADVIELCNISTAGCCIVTTKTLKPGDNVLLKLPSEKVSSPLKCTIIWERTDEEPAAKEAAAPLRRAGLKFSDLDTGTLVRIKDFMRLVGIPSDQKLEDGLRPGPLRFSIFTHEKATLNYPVSFPVRKISLGGMLAGTETDLREGERYPMAIYLPGSDRPVKFRGRVASKIPREGGFDIGVEFCDMSEADRGRLAAFIKALSAGR